MGMMNMMNLVKQVQSAQKRAETAQKELAALEITGESAGGAVKVVCDGQGKFKSIKISPEAKSESIEMLEDMITVAMNQASEKAAQAMQEKMKVVTGGINIPGLNF